MLNFYGGAGIGKSTIATDIVQDQLYLFAEQVHRLKTLDRYGVEYAICDSPLPLNIIYNNTPDALFE